MKKNKIDKKELLKLHFYGTSDIENLLSCSRPTAYKIKNDVSLITLQSGKRTLGTKVADVFLFPYIHQNYGIDLNKEREN